MVWRGVTCKNSKTHSYKKWVNPMNQRFCKQHKNISWVRKKKDLGIIFLLILTFFRWALWALIACLLTSTRFLLLSSWDETEVSSVILSSPSSLSLYVIIIVSRVFHGGLSFTVRHPNLFQFKFLVYKFHGIILLLFRPTDTSFHPSSWILGFAGRKFEIFYQYLLFNLSSIYHFCITSVHLITNE